MGIWAVVTACLGFHPAPGRALQELGEMELNLNCCPASCFLTNLENACPRGGRRSQGKRDSQSRREASGSFGIEVLQTRRDVVSATPDKLWRIWYSALRAVVGEVMAISRPGFPELSRLQPWKPSVLETGTVGHPTKRSLATIVWGALLIGSAQRCPFPLLLTAFCLTPHIPSQPTPTPMSGVPGCSNALCPPLGYTSHLPRPHTPGPENAGQEGSGC